MTYCAHIDRTEDLVLGLLSAAARIEAEEHVLVCSDCRQAHRELEEERELFARRAPRLEVLAPPPYLAPAVFETRPESRKRIFERSLPAVLAIAASIAFPVVGHFHHGAEPKPEVAVGGSSQEIFASNERLFSDEPVACAAPLVRAGGASIDRRMSAHAPSSCEDPLASLAESMP
jgi:anti-sigma factor RsiW